MAHAGKFVMVFVVPFQILYEPPVIISACVGLTQQQAVYPKEPAGSVVRTDPVLNPVPFSYIGRLLFVVWPIAQNVLPTAMLSCNWTLACLPDGSDAHPKALFVEQT
jgi:hypothetical protein